MNKTFILNNFLSYIVDKTPKTLKLLELITLKQKFLAEKMNIRILATSVV